MIGAAATELLSKEIVSRLQGWLVILLVALAYANPNHKLGELSQS